MPKTTTDAMIGLEEEGVPPVGGCAAQQMKRTLSADLARSRPAANAGERSPSAFAAPAPAPAAVHVATPRVALPPTTPDRSFTPTMQMMSPMAAGAAAVGAAAAVGGGSPLVGGSFAEMAAFMEKQQTLLLERDAQARQDTEAKLETQRREMEVEDEQGRTEQQTVALQTRVEALHTAKLISDEERDAIEDAVADSLDEDDTRERDRVARMVALSGRVGADAAFARQLRRKFV